MRTLVLTLEYPTRSSFYDDWKDAFARSSTFRTTVRNILNRSTRRQISREIGDYELIVVLHSCTGETLDYVKDLVPPLDSRRGKLVAFIGNEFNLPWNPLRDKIAWLSRVRPDIVATQLLAEAGEWLYAETGCRVISLPHALNPDVFRPVVPQSKRTIDLGGRSWHYVVYVGDNDRSRIYDFFINKQFEPPLIVDFSTVHRFDRNGWAAFLNRCKATAATEAGSWYLERDDATAFAIRDYIAGGNRSVAVRVGSPLSRLARRLPYAAKVVLRKLARAGFVDYEALSAERLDFAEIYGRFFAGRKKAPVYSKCISSRHFDAIGCKTLQIMFPGRYGDILRADEHYVALNQDFSNIDEVLDLLRDVAARQRIVDRTYDYVMSEHTYKHRLQHLERALEENGNVREAEKRGKNARNFA
jgi:hypothetical protein